MVELTDCDATSLSALIGQGIVAPSEVMAATLARIGAVNPAVNAIVSLRDGDALMAEAVAADDAPRKGWLHGIPLAVKDLADAEGLPTTQGSPLFAGKVAARDDLMVARLRNAGAIIIGKTNTPEFGLGSHSFNPVFGVTRNPFDLTRSAGGSSGGAGAALATGMVSVADGSDMMGSLRNPAAWNNVYGMRPTWALVPPEPEGEMFLHQLSTLGPMARTPRDIARLLGTMSGPDPMQPHGRPTFEPGQAQPARPQRIGWLGDWGGAYAMEAGLLDCAAAAVTRLAGLGHRVEPVAPPFAAEGLWESWITLRSWAVAGSLAGLEIGALKPEAVWEVERGLALSAAEVQRASLVRSAWFRAAARLFETFDALVLPATQVWPFPAGWRWPREIAGRAMDSYHRWMEVVVPASLIGLPCICLPCGTGPSGLPHGLQLIGPRDGDGGLIAIAQEWEEARPAQERRVVTPGPVPPGLTDGPA
jgi:amidase